MPRLLTLVLAAACALLTHIAAAQGVTGALIGTVQDAQGAVLRGAVVHVNSRALIGGPQKLTTNQQGQLRFPASEAIESVAVFALAVDPNERRARTRRLRAVNHVGRGPVRHDRSVMIPVSGRVESAVLGEGVNE
jgi:hypothetical protein